MKETKKCAEKCDGKDDKYVSLLEENNKSLKRRCAELQMVVYEQNQKIERLLGLNVDKDEFWHTIREKLKKV